MKKPTLDGSSNLEQTLNILPPESDIEDAELIPMENDDLNELTTVNTNVPSTMHEPDKEIRDDIKEVYERAIDAFDDNMEAIETMEPKFKSRAIEVSQGYLSSALEAIKIKQRTKEHADKMTLETAKVNGGGGTGAQTADTINNNILVADRNDILKAFAEKRAADKNAK